MPKTVLEMMDVNNNEVQFNCLKSMEITNINIETLLLHPSAHEFWEEEEIRKSLLEFLIGWSRNPMVYAKNTQTPQDEATSALKCDKNNGDKLIEVGFVDGLFEMFK